MTNKIYSPIPVGTLIASIVLAYFLDRHAPFIEIIPSPFNKTGWIIVASGIGSMIFAVLALTKNKTTIFPGEKPSALVTSGPFSFSRNPIYLLDVVVAMGAAVILGSLSAFVAPLICFLVLNFLVIPYEEKKLKTLFGSAYKAYLNSVRRWI